MVDHTIEMAAAQYGMAGIQIAGPHPRRVDPGRWGLQGMASLMQLAHQLDQERFGLAGEWLTARWCHEGCGDRRRPHRLADGAQLSAAVGVGQSRALATGLAAPLATLLFLLADTRALTPSEAAVERNREHCHAIWIKRWLQQGLGRGDQVLLVSRGDSTLRGHGVLEPACLGGGLWTI